MQTREVEALRERFRIRELFAEGLVPRANISPTAAVASVHADASEPGQGRVLRLLRWGLVPAWAKDLKDGPHPINAKAETLAKSPLFRRLLGAQRCLIPADGFYEWVGPKGHRRPLKIGLKSGELFAFAGLWDSWRDPAASGPELSTCTLITCSPNELMAPIHDRMPVILRPEDEERWLQPSRGGSPPPLELLRPYHSSEMALGEAPAELKPRQLELMVSEPRSARSR